MDLGKIRTEVKLVEGARNGCRGWPGLITCSDLRYPLASEREKERERERNGCPTFQATLKDFTADGIRMQDTPSTLFCIDFPCQQKNKIVRLKGWQPFSVRKKRRGTLQKTVQSILNKNL